MMPVIAENILEKVDWIADRIRELLTGSKTDRLGEVKERAPRGLRLVRFRPGSPSDEPCGKYEEPVRESLPGDALLCRSGFPIGYSRRASQGFFADDEGGWERAQCEIPK